jgi:hypothetical protein
MAAVCPPSYSRHSAARIGLAMPRPIDRICRFHPMNIAHPAAATALLLLVAACQPLPHPFADDVPPPGSPLMTLRDMPTVSIAPVEGEPPETAQRLGPAMAEALQKREIAATDRTAGLNSYQLTGRIQAMPVDGDKAAVGALWVLRAPSGKLLGERGLRVEAGAGDWQAGRSDAVARLAAAGADQIAALLEDKAPTEAAAATAGIGGGRTRLLIGRVEGATGDGAQALEKAIALLLQRQDIAIETDPRSATDLVLAADVTVGPPAAGKQHVKIVWHVRRSDGGEIGTVAQENDVPAGLLDGAWGDVAYSVAIAAQDGIMVLVARGAPPPSGKS